MVLSSLQAQHSANSSRTTLFSSPNSSISSIGSTSSYSSSLAFTPVSSTSCLSLLLLDKSNNDKSLPALRFDYALDPSFQQQPQQRYGCSFISPTLSKEFVSKTQKATSPRKRSALRTNSMDPPKPEKIRRPPNSFLIYRQEQVRLHPGQIASRLSKILSKKWKAESAERKAHFALLAQLAREEHARRYPEYKFTPAKRGTGKKAIAVRAAAAAAATVVASSISSSSLMRSAQPLSSCIAVSTTTTEKNLRPLPALPDQHQQQQQSNPQPSSPSNHRRVAPYNSISSPPSIVLSSTIPSTSQQALPPTPTLYPTSTTASSSLLFDPYGSPSTQQSLLAMLNNSLSPQTPLPSLRTSDVVNQCSTFALHQQQQPLTSPMTPLPPSFNSIPLSTAYGSPIDCSWDTCQLEGTQPTHTPVSATYISQAMKSFLGCYGNDSDYFPLVSTSQGLSLSSPSPSPPLSQPALASMIRAFSQPLSLSATMPAWTFHPLSSGIMMENDMTLSPAMSPCSSMSSSFTDMSPLHLMNSHLDPSSLLKHEKLACDAPMFQMCNNDPVSTFSYAS